MNFGLDSPNNEQKKPVKPPIELLIREPGGFHIEGLHSDSRFIKKRARRINEVEIKKLKTKTGNHDYYLIKNTKNDRYVRVSDEDMFLWKLMDGVNSINDIAVAYFNKYGSFNFERIRNLITRLKSESLLEVEKLGIIREVSYRLGPLGKILNFLTRTEYSFKDLDSKINKIYSNGAWLLFTLPALLLLSAVSIAGFFFFRSVVNSGDHSLFAISNSILLGLVFCLFVFVTSAAVHETAHALTCKHYGRVVKKGGFLLDFGRPVFFADITDIWMASKRGRILTYLAGPFSSIALAGAASIAAYYNPAAGVNSLLIKLAFYSYVIGIFNLCPLILVETDGYHVLMDLLGIPGLKSQSMSFIKTELPNKLKRGLKLTRREISLLFFALASLLTLSLIMSLLGRYLAQLIIK